MKYADNLTTIMPILVRMFTNIIATIKADLSSFHDYRKIYTQSSLYHGEHLRVEITMDVRLPGWEEELDDEPENEDF